MKENVKITFVVAITVILSITLVSMAFIASNNDSSADKTDVTGHWYVVYECNYDRDGEYNEYDPLEQVTFKHGFDVYDVINSEFYGKYMGQKISGIISENLIMFSCLDGSEQINIMGSFDGKNIVFIQSTYGEYGAQMAYIVLSKDPVSLDITLNAPDISGIWNSCEARMYYSGTYSVLPDTILNVEEQIGHTYKGNMTTAEGSIGFKGCIMHVGEIIQGYYICDDGDMFTVLYQDNTLFAMNNDLNNIHCSENSVINYVFTVGGTPSKLEIGDYTGVTLTSSKSNVLTSSGSSDDTLYRNVLVTNSTMGNILFSDVMINGVSYEVTSYAFYFGNGSYRIFSNIDGNPVLGLFKDNFLYLYMIGIDGSMVQMVKYVVFDSDNVDYVGHWYASYMVGFDEDGNEYARSIETDKSLSDYSLDIYSYVDGVIYGRYFNDIITGSMVGDLLDIKLVSDSIKMEAIGYFQNNEILTFGGVVYNPETKGISAYKLYMSRTYTTMSQIEDINEFLGDWSLESGISYNEGEIVNLRGNDFSINSVNDETFSGKIELFNNAQTIVEHDIRGLIFAGSALSLGLAVDDFGNIWTIKADDEHIHLVIADYDVFNDKYVMCAVERVYIKNETHVHVKEDFDVIGSWVSTERVQISANGYVFKNQYNYTMEILGSHKGFVYGTCNDGHFDGSVAIAITNYETQVYVDACMNYDGHISYSVGILVDEDHMIISESYFDSYGMMVTESVTFEKVS